MRAQSCAMQLVSGLICILGRRIAGQQSLGSPHCGILVGVRDMSYWHALEKEELYEIWQDQASSLDMVRVCDEP